MRTAAVSSIMSLLPLVSCAVFGHVPTVPAFEVASVRPSNRPNAFPQGRGGPGSRYDPERLHLESTPMRNLLLMAYGLEPNQISGPGWLGSEAYDIDAKVAPGATKEQFNVMFQNFLAERFGLKVHYETRDIARYELVVAKNGPKLKETDPGAGAWNPSDGPPKAGKDKDGLPEIPPGHILMGTFTTSVGARISARGKYDFNLTFSTSNAAVSADQSDRAPSIFIALEDQLGLKLVAKKLAIDVMVIDHIEKLPTEN